jgi:hypothetical protein
MGELRRIKGNLASLFPCSKNPNYTCCIIKELSMKKLALILLILSNFQCMLLKDSPLDPNGDLSLLRLLGMLSNRDRPAQPTVFLHARIDDGNGLIKENVLAAYNPETNEFRYKTPNLNSMNEEFGPTDSRYNIPMVADPVRPVVYLYLSHFVGASTYQHRVVKLDIATGSILGEALFPTQTGEIPATAMNGIAYDPISDSIFFGVLGKSSYSNNYIYEINATDLSLTKIHNIPRIVSTNDAKRGGIVYHSEDSTIDFFWFDYDSTFFNLYVNSFRVGYEIAPSNTIQATTTSQITETSGLIPIFDPSQNRYLVLDKISTPQEFKLYSFNRENYTSSTIFTLGTLNSNQANQTVLHPNRQSLFSFLNNVPNILALEINIVNGAEVQSIPLESSLGEIAQGSHYIHPSSNRLYFVKETNTPDPLSCVNGVYDLNTNLTSYSSPFHTATTGGFYCQVKWVNYVE